jgi:hypothetical protein
LLGVEKETAGVREQRGYRLYDSKGKDVSRDATGRSQKFRKVLGVF